MHHRRRARHGRRGRDGCAPTDQPHVPDIPGPFGIGEPFGHGFEDFQSKVGGIARLGQQGVGEGVQRFIGERTFLAGRGHDVPRSGITGGDREQGVDPVQPIGGRGGGDGICILVGRCFTGEVHAVFDAFEHRSNRATQLPLLRVEGGESGQHAHSPFANRAAGLRIFHQTGHLLIRLVASGVGVEAGAASGEFKPSHPSVPNRGIATDDHGGRNAPDFHHGGGEPRLVGADTTEIHDVAQGKALPG